MRPVTIQGTAITTSPLGFGCAGLFREPSARRRRALLDAAHAVGITHFDVAPMYGFGIAEHELGHFARRRRGQLTIATKYGIAVTPVGSAVGRVQHPVRRLLAAAPHLGRRARSAAADPRSGPAGALLYREAPLVAASARAGVERSLRELGTDYLDLLLLHDPAPGSGRADDVCDYLTAAQAAGTIRAWGVTGEPPAALTVAGELATAPAVLQVHDDILMGSATERRHPSPPGRITYGVLGAALHRILQHVTGDPARRRRWQDATGCDCAAPGALARLLLQEAAAVNSSGVVLFSTTREQHLAAAVDALVDPRPGGDESVDALRRLVAAEALDRVAGT